VNFQTYWHLPAYSLGDISTTLYQNKKFRNHLFVAVISVVICVLGWLVSDFFASVFPWPLVFVWLFGLTLAYHYYIFVLPRHYLQLNYAWFFITLLFMIFTWACQYATDLGDANEAQNWYLYPGFIWGIFLALHDAHVRYHTNPDRFFYYHTRLFVILSLFFYMIHLDNSADAPYPWFLFAILYFGLFFVIHWCRHFYPGDYFRVHAAIFTDLQLVLYFAWATSYIRFGWFVWPFLIWSFALALHYRVNDPTIAEERRKSLLGVKSTDVEKGESVPVYGAFANEGSESQDNRGKQFKSYMGPADDTAVSHQGTL